MTGLVYFEKFISHTSTTTNETIETLIPKIKANQLDIYTLIEDFVNFIINDLQKSSSTARESVKAISSFFRSERLPLDPKILSDCAGIPKTHREGEFPLDKVMVSKILQ